MSDANIPLNGDRSALPFTCQGPTTAPEFYYGLTKRERFAGLAMQGLLAGLSNPEVIKSTVASLKGQTLAQCIAGDAVALADALLERLNP